MIQKREIIGRTLGESPFSGDDAPTDIMRFVLKSGRKVTFQTETIPAEQVEKRTYVDPMINGRDQNALTKESLADIISTLPNQQFFPAIGRLVEGRIEILDGSRRRASAILCGVGLRVMYTKSEMTAEEARQLAAEIQTAKEHNIREVGIRLIALRDQGMNQKEIAAHENISPTKVTRAIQAASVPGTMLTVFPDPSLLTYPDYKTLFTLTQLAEDKRIQIDDLVLDVMKGTEELTAESLHPDIHKERVLKLFENSVIKLINKPKAEKATVETLKKYDDKRAYARKKSDSKDRKVTYEFSRISKEAQDKIDEAIRSIIEKYS